MQVFHIKEDKLYTAKEIPFRNEDELQNLIDNNLKEIFGLELVKQQYTLDDLRMDTVAFDSNNNAFVIIEYKNSANFSVVDQGYAYLNLLLDKKADLILLYRERLSKDLNKDDVDWSATKILFISPSLVHKLLLYGRITEFMDRFMLCAENHTTTTLGLGRILKRGGSFPSYIW